MKMFIPTIGTPVRLIADWSFTLYDEYRNESIFNPLSSVKKTGWRNERDSMVVTLPKGTLLTVDRLYIRKGGDGMGEYDSVTFNIRETTHPKLIGVKRMRFWAKLPDVNQMEFETEYPKEVILRAIVSTHPGADPEIAIKWLGEKRFEIIKHYQVGDHFDIITMAPKKRYESVFASKIKYNRNSGYQWDNAESLKLYNIFFRGLRQNLLDSITLQKDELATAK